MSEGLARKLTGVELVRLDDEDEWKPLFESRVFRREVPGPGDPREAARWRVLQAVGGHFAGFFITGVVMYSTQGHLPFWMAIWGSVLAVQAVGAAPTAWTLLGRRRAELAASGDKAVPLPAAEAPLLAARAEAPIEQTTEIAREAARVRALIDQRGGPDAKRLLERLRVRRDVAEHQLKQLRLTSPGAPRAASTCPSCPPACSSSATR
jgi:hypothetical protein